MKPQSAERAELVPAATRLRLWSRGIALSAPVFLISALAVRGWQDAAAVRFLICIGVLTLFWSYLLARASHWTVVLRHVGKALLGNSLALLLLATALIGATGASLSPLFWLYLVLTVVDTLQDRRRGLVIAWASWAMFCGLLIAQGWHWLPDARTGAVFATPPLGAAWFLHPLGIAVWYFVIALASSAWSRWVARHERTLRQQQDAITQREQAVETARAKIQAERHEFGQGLAQLDHTKRQIAAEQARLEQDRQQWNRQRAQAIQDLTEGETALAERTRQIEQQQVQLQHLRVQLDEERAAWEQQRIRMVKMLDDREAALLEQTQELDEAKRGFELQRTETTQSLLHLEQTLLNNLKRVRDEIGQVEAKRQEAQEGQREFAARREQWIAEQARTEQALAARAEAVATRTQECEQRHQQLQNAEAAFEKVRDRALRELTQREQELHERREQLEESRRQVANQQQILEERQAQAQARVAEQEAQVAQRAAGVEEREGCFANQATVLEQTRKQLDALHEEVNTKLQSVTQQTHRLEQERQVLEQEQQRLLHEVSQRERSLHEQLEKLEAQRTDCQAAQERLTEHAKQLETERRGLLQERIAWERQRDEAAKALASPRGVFVQRARQALQAQARRLRDQGRQIAQQQRDLAAREGALEHQQLESTRQGHALQLARQGFDSEREQLLQRLRQREVELAERLQQVGEAEHRLSADRAELEHARRRVEEAGRARESTEHQRIRAETQQLRTARQELEAAQLALAKRQQASEAQFHQWEQAKRTAEEAAAMREQGVVAQRRALEEQRHAAAQARQQWERMRGRLDERIARQEQKLTGQAQQLDERQRQLASLQQQLEDARRALAEASRSHALDPSSSETLALLANEFTVPLASIDALLATLLDGDHGKLSPSILELLRDVRKTSGRLRRVVTDALDAMRIEQGQLPTSIQPVALGGVLAQAEQDIQDQLEAKGLTLSHQGNDALTLTTDPQLARRILSALLANAVQYTEQGGITVTCATKAGGVVVTIADTGVGVQPGQWAQLFDKPKIGTLVHARGLSLYLIRSLARSIGGDVTLLSSELEHGSAFAATFPTTQDETLAASALPSSIVGV